MLSPDRILINRAAKIIPEYRDTRPRRSRTIVVYMRVIAPIILVAIAYLLQPFMPVKPAELSSVNLGVFVIAVALSRFCGRSGVWVAASSAVLAIAWVAPPEDSLAIEVTALPWFTFLAVMIAV